MKEMYELERRFNSTGSKGVEPLSDKELKKLRDYYDECIWYFNQTDNRVIAYRFITNKNIVEGCLAARGIK